MYTNALTGHEYSASNQQQIHDSANFHGFTSFLVAGYAQWNELGYQVQKGQTSTRIIMIVEKKIKNSDEKKKVPKTIRVFFQDQVEPIKTDE